MGKYLNNEDQKNSLLERLKDTNNKKYAEKIKIILLLDEGVSIKNIARYLFVD